MSENSRPGTLSHASGSNSSETIPEACLTACPVRVPEAGIGAGASKEHLVRRPAVLILLLAVLGAILARAPAGRAAAGSAPAALTVHDSSGLHVVNLARIDPRQYDVSVSSAALGRVVHVRLL